jgi:hypothetical protein
VTSTGAKCTYTTVEFSWDGKRVAIATVDPSNPKDPSYCSATQVFKQPPTTTPRTPTNPRIRRGRRARDIYAHRGAPLAPVNGPIRPID